MSLSDKLYLVVQTQEPFDKEEWMRRIAKVLLCNDDKRKTDGKTRIRKSRHEQKQNLRNR